MDPKEHDSSDESGSEEDVEIPSEKEDSEDSVVDGSQEDEEEYHDMSIRLAKLYWRFNRSKGILWLLESQRIPFDLLNLQYNQR
jgi:hypothetical protein